MSVAIIRFPGSNCESETQLALKQLDIPSTIIDWTTTNDELNTYSGFIIPGGFSFQDRVRAGVIASKLDILESLREQSEQRKKPILGICNGAQILAESGIISLDSNQPELDVSIDMNYVNGHSTNFISDWSFLKPFNTKNSVFLEHFSDTDVIPIQICHAEGRYIISSEPQSGLKYCNLNGEISDQFPITPNGSTNAIAAVSNDAGNAFAIMPHPERSLNQARLPYSIQHKIKSDGLTIANWESLFLTFRNANA